MTDEAMWREDQEDRLEHQIEVSKALDDHAPQLLADDRAALYDRLCEIIMEWGEIVGDSVQGSFRE